MNDPATTHILFSVAGMTPAVITETLFGLHGEGVHGGEVHILTTSRGRRDMQQLLEEDGQVAAFNRAYQTQWLARYEWIEAISSEASQPGATLGQGAMPLEDLRTTADNTAAANLIVRRVQALTERPNVAVHASVAGGRKTMGLFLTQAMSWFARPQDDLSHVLVAAEYERPGFFFPEPGNPLHQGVVDFALLPFVRMRGLLPPLFARGGSYSDLVRLSQVYLDDSLNRQGALTLDPESGRLSIAGLEVVHLQPLGVGLYLFLFRHANAARGQPAFFLRRAFAQREDLAGCLEEAGVGSQAPESGDVGRGLGALARADSIDDWPDWWRQQGGQGFADHRDSDLNNAFTRLNGSFRSLWSNAGFRVLQNSGRGSADGPSRWVDIAPRRLRVI